VQSPIMNDAPLINSIRMSDCDNVGLFLAIIRKITLSIGLNIEPFADLKAMQGRLTLVTCLVDIFGLCD
jgi:hypothetical protein